MADYFDELDMRPREPERVWGVAAAFRVAARGAQSANEPGVRGMFRPDPTYRDQARALATARARAYLDNAPPTKYADETMHPSDITFAAVQGIEQDVQAMNTAAYVAAQHSSRSPLISGQNYVTQRKVQQAQVNLNGDGLLDAGDEAMLGLLYSF